MLVGFHQDLRNFTEIANAMRTLRKLLIWEKVKSTKAAIIIKVSWKSLGTFMLALRSPNLMIL